MTRTEIIQSAEYLRLIALPNDILCRVLQKHIDTPSTPFTGWDVMITEIDNSVISQALDNADILFPTTSNSAPAGAGITQSLYFLRETP